MVINMRYLLFFFFLFLHSYVVFAQEPPPAPSCANSGTWFCVPAGGSAGPENQCINQNPLAFLKTRSSSGCAAWGQGAFEASCGSNCTCPEGFTLNTVVQAGMSSSSCIPDEPSQPPQCAAGEVYYLGFCRDSVENPSACGNTYDTAISVDGSYVCATGGCDPSSTITNYSTENGSWAVCGSGGDTPSSSGSNSSPPSSSPSGGDSSTGSGTGDGGGDSSSGSGAGAGDGSGNSSGGQTSSVAGTGGGSGGQSTSSTSSARGAASSGSGAGNCDPTAHDYLDCISRENPGEGGDGIGDINQEGYELDIQQRLQQARDKYTNKVTQIKQDFESELSLSISTGGGSLPTKSVNLFGKNVDLGIASRSDFFDLIKWLFLAIASVVSVYILFAPR